MTSRMWAVQDARVYARRRADGLVFLCQLVGCTGVCKAPCRRDGLVWRVMPVISRHLHRRLSQTAFSECALTSIPPAPGANNSEDRRGRAGGGSGGGASRQGSGLQLGSSAASNCFAGGAACVTYQTFTRTLERDGSSRSSLTA